MLMWLVYSLLTVKQIYNSIVPLGTKTTNANMAVASPYMSSNSTFSLFADSSLRYQADIPISDRSVQCHLCRESR